MMKAVCGAITALVTPFTEDERVNYDKLGELIDWQIDSGIDGLVILGTTGEAVVLDHEESVKVASYAVKRADGRVPVILGSGSNCTRTMLEKSLEYERLGADGLLLITPYYDKGSEEGIYRHFLTVADAVHVPCIMYNVPSRTGCSIPISAVRRLAGHENIMGIKEASGSMSYMAQVSQYCGEDFVMYSGNDDAILPVLSIGGVGVISVYGNVMPREAHEIVADYLGGERERALRTHLKYLPLINALFMEVNPIPVKEAMNMMGLGVGGYRLPLCPMEENNREKLRKIMKECGVI